MKTTIITVTITTALCVAILLYWLTYTPDTGVTYSAYSKPTKVNVNAEAVKIGEFFERFVETNSLFVVKKSENWPNFRGKDHSNIYNSRPLGENLQKIWTIELGEGHAAAAIYEGQVFVLDYLEDEEADALRCFVLKTGEEIWRRWTKIEIKRNHGKSRTIPAVDSNIVLTISPKCQVMAVDRKDGNLLWGIDLPTEFHTDIPMWYTGQCPLIDNNQAIIAIGSEDVLIAAFDTLTGKELWSVQNPNKIQMSHSSIIPMTILNKRCYIYAGIGGIVAISAEEKDLGKTLWTLRDWIPNVIAPSPIQLTDNSIFFSAGYGAGSAIVNISKSDSQYTAALQTEYKPKFGIALEQQSPIKLDDYIIAILPKDAGAMRTQLVAAKIDSPTNIEFNSGNDLTFGLGPFMVADNKIYALNDDGKLSIFSFDENSGFQEIKTQQILNGHDAWGPLAIADGYLIARDSKNMTCIKLSSQ
ncbi:MAG: PQQ-binding-like beta-propeller repeat protein [Kiritimatiellae bacterium]|jgi:outer membrane protein assembly factor BamB|nr:PQQ-binding-like beta-propeller repeat protein [Kiritimatiellia bacterium]